MLITFEGINGVGKDYIINYIKEKLPNINYITSKPDFSKNDFLLKSITNFQNLSMEESIKYSNIFLDNILNISKTIKPNEVYISNRWTLSNYIYTIHSLTKYFQYKDLIKETEIKPEIDKYFKYNIDVLAPDYIFYIYADLDIVRERSNKRNKYKATYEKDNDPERLTELYKKSFNALYPSRCFYNGINKTKILNFDNTKDCKDKVLEEIYRILDIN